jgi:hypothetical protein
VVEQAGVLRAEAQESAPVGVLALDDLAVPLDLPAQQAGLNVFAVTLAQPTVVVLLAAVPFPKGGTPAWGALGGLVLARDGVGHAAQVPHDQAEDHGADWEQGGDGDGPGDGELSLDGEGEQLETLDPWV